MSDDNANMLKEKFVERADEPNDSNKDDAAVHDVVFVSDDQIPAHVPIDFPQPAPGPSLLASLLTPQKKRTFVPFDSETEAGNKKQRNRTLLVCIACCLSLMVTGVGVGLVTAYSFKLRHEGAMDARRNIQEVKNRLDSLAAGQAQPPVNSADDIPHPGLEGEIFMPSFPAELDYHPTTAFEPSPPFETVDWYQVVYDARTISSKKVHAFLSDLLTTLTKNKAADTHKPLDTIPTFKLDSLSQRTLWMYLRETRHKLPSLFKLLALTRDSEQQHQDKSGAAGGKKPARNEHQQLSESAAIEVSEWLKRSALERWVVEFWRRHDAATEDFIHDYQAKSDMLVQKALADEESDGVKATPGPSNPLTQLKRFLGSNPTFASPTATPGFVDNATPGATGRKLTGAEDGSVAKQTDAQLLQLLIDGDIDTFLDTLSESTSNNQQQEAPLTTTTTATTAAISRRALRGDTNNNTSTASNTNTSAVTTTQEVPGITVNEYNPDHAETEGVDGTNSEGGAGTQQASEADTLTMPDPDGPAIYFPYGVELDAAGFKQVNIPVIFHVTSYVDGGFQQPGGAYWDGTNPYQRLIDLLNINFDQSNTNIQFSLEEARYNVRDHPYLLLGNYSDWQKCANMTRGCFMQLAKQHNEDTSKYLNVWVGGTIINSLQATDCQRCVEGYTWTAPYSWTKSPAHETETWPSQHVYLSWDMVDPATYNNADSWDFGGFMLTHQVGHFLGVSHSSKGGCEGTDDFASDTPSSERAALMHMYLEADQWCGEQLRHPYTNADHSLDLTEIKKFDSCLGDDNMDDIFNFMSEAPLPCTLFFTPGQSFVMHTVLKAFRPTMHNA